LLQCSKQNKTRAVGAVICEIWLNKLGERAQLEKEAGAGYEVKGKDLKITLP
jgi:hypothetical protein